MTQLRLNAVGGIIKSIRVFLYSLISLLVFGGGRGGGGCTLGGGTAFSALASSHLGFAFFDEQVSWWQVCFFGS